MTEALRDVLRLALLADDNDLDSITDQFRDKLRVFLQGDVEQQDLVNKIVLSEETEANFKIDGKCERIIVQGDSIACNYDKPNSYGMRFFCRNCFAKEDHSNSNTKLFKNHGVCQSISRPEYINKEAKVKMIKEINEGPNKDTFESFKIRLGQMLVIFFESTSSLCTAGKHEFVEIFFLEVTDQLTVLCKSFASMPYLIMEVFTSSCKSLKGNLPRNTILEEYFFWNSQWECLPSEYLAVLFTFLTIYDKFNRLAVEMIFKYFVETYMLNPEDSRMYYYQLVLKLISFDKESIAMYIQSPEFRKFLIDLRNACEAYYSIDEMKNKEEMNDLTVFVFNQLQLLLDCNESAVALTTCPESLKEYMSLQLVFQDIEQLDYNQESYYTYDINNFNTIVNSHDALLLTFSSIVHRLWQSSNREQCIVNCLKEVATFVVDKHESSIMKTNRYVSLLKPAQRIFAIGVMALCVTPDHDTQGREDPKVSFDKETLEKVLQKVFKDNQQMQKFFIKMFREEVRCQGFCSEISRQMWAKFGDDEMQDMLYDYMKTNFTLYDSDIVFLKIAMLFIPDQELNNMYKYYCVSQNFQKLFDADPMKLYQAAQEEWFEKMFLIYKDFWTFLNYLLVDELSISNLSIYALDQEIYLKAKYKYMKIFDTAREFAKSAVYCLGSCNASKLNDTAFWYFPYRTPFLKLVDEELEFDPRTFIFRLNKEESEYTAQHLKLEIFNRNISVASEIFSKLDEQKVNSHFLVTQCRPCKSPASRTLLVKVMQKKFVKDIFTLFDSYLLQNEFSEQLLPIFLRLTNNFIWTLASIREVTGSISASTVDFLKSNYVHKWSQSTLKNTSLESMVKQVKKNMDAVANPASKPQEDMDEKPAVDEKKTQEKNAQKKKMEEKLAKMKSKMKKRQNDLLLDHLGDDKERKDSQPMDLEKPDRKEYPERLENICCFCLAKIDQEAESTYFTYMRLTKTVSSDMFFPLVSGCGHALHKSCFHDFKQKSKKLKHASFKIQLPCLQCKLLANSFICKKSAFIDVDFLKKTLTECNSYFTERMSGTHVDDRLTISLVHFVDLILKERHNFLMSMLIQSYLDIYGLILDHWLNVTKQSAGSDELLASLTGELTGVKISHPKVVTAILTLKSQHTTMEEAFCKLAKAVSDDNCMDVDGVKIAAFLTFVVNKRWISLIDDKSWCQLTSQADSTLSEEFLVNQVFQCEDMYEDSIRDSSTILAKRVPVKCADDQKPKPFDTIRKYKKFVNLVNEYGRLGCSKCGDWPKDFSKCLLVCLTCQHRICKSLCNTEDQEIDNVQQSLNEIEHALTHHGGSCVYISLFTGALHLVDSPLSKLN